MAERAAKLRRLECLRRSNPHISASALSELIADIEKHGLPDLHNRKHVKEARDATLSQHTAYGPLLCTASVVDKSGNKRSFLYVNFPTMLQAMFMQGGGMCQLIKNTMLKKPCSAQSPWGICFYSDEVVPGNVLSADVSRKIQCVYISFMEYGAVALSKEASWTCIMACRSSFVNDIEGGMSQITSVLLQKLLYPDTCSPKISGVLLKHELGEMVRIFYKLGSFLQDGSAQKYVFHLKGDGGTKFCLFCANLFTHKSGLKQEDGTDVLVADEWNLAKVHQASDQDIAGTIARLEEKSMVLNKGDFQLWQQAVGFNYSAYALLHCKDLKEDVLPISQFLHDWMHCFLVSGIFQTIMFLLLSDLEAAFGDVYATIEPCVRSWNMPSAKATSLANLFAKKRQVANHKAGTFKCTASEALALLPVFGYFLTQLIMPQANAQTKKCCQAYFALADIIDLIQLVPLDLISPATIDRAATTFIDMCLDAGFKDHMHTKFHWVLHFGQHLKVHKILPSCFVQERKHKMVKRYQACLSIYFSFV